ncbi:hypothetical protein [Alcanivorax sp.]|uniref:hypothetical protein n=1 Tax=Alcanivorax sp. TaxID=1872427 RepID=UPI0025BEFCC5|nr:hypothetical protein [Alcanivorax sp.]
MRKAGLVMAALLGGCASLGDPQQQVSEALAEDDYARAAAIIEQTHPDHDQYALLQEQYPGIILASNQYRQRLILEAEAMSRKQHWEQAHNLIAAHRDKVVDPSALGELLAALSSLEEHQLNQLLAERRQSQASALMQNADLTEKLSGFHLPKAKQERQQLAEERRYVVEDMTRLGEYFAQRQQWLLARDLLSAAHRLAPEQPPSPQLAKAQQILNDASKRARARHNRALLTEADQLMARYQRNGQLDALLAARRFLNQHQNNPALSDHQKRLEQWARRRFSEEMNTGEALYARGQYREAYRIWTQVAPLYPDNEELIKKLERSRRVLTNLRNLQDD